MIGDEETKYTRVEFERRFLVSPCADWRRDIEPYTKKFQDKYLHDTRLRLRMLTDSDTGRQIIKLTKKCESSSPYFQTISRILLSPAEYELMDRLPGDRLEKVRHYHSYQGRTYSIDVFAGPLTGLIVCETEADELASLMLAEPPPYAKPSIE